jgi:hypothetical protein
MVVLRSGNRCAAWLMGTLFSASMLPAAAFAYTPEQEQACSGDALRLCSSEIPDVERITACMAQHKAELSPPCQAQFTPPPNGAAATDEPDGVKPAKPRRSKSAKPHRLKKPAKTDRN